MFRRLLARVPERYRPLARILLLIAAALFVAFEISRLAAVGAFLLPIWRAFPAQMIALQPSTPLWIAIVALAVTVLAFAAMLSAFIFGLVALRRRMSR